MDDAFKKISKVFGGKKGFKGHGHRLGTAGDEPSKESPLLKLKADLDPQEQRPVPDRQKAGSSAPGRRGGSELAAPSSQAANPNAFAGRPQRLGAAASAQPETQPARHERAISKPAAPVAAAASGANGSGAAQPPAAAHSRGDAPDAEAAAASEAVCAAIELLRAGPEEPRAVLARLLGNIARSPGEERFRRVRLGNPRIQAAVVEPEGGLELLQALPLPPGLSAPHTRRRLTAAGPAAGMRLPSRGRGAGRRLPRRRLCGAAGGRGAPGADGGGAAVEGPSEPRPPPASSGPCDRQTQVLLPSAPEGAGEIVPDWVFKRTPAELKAAMLEARRKREQSEVLMTRAMREKLRLAQQQPQPRATKCTVRVRLPEGLLLQGSFNADEPVAAVFDWVTDCLAEPGNTYDLVLPDRKPLVTAMGTLRSAKLLPNTLLLMRCTGRGGAQEQLTVRHELLLGQTN